MFLRFKVVLARLHLELLKMWMKSKKFSALFIPGITIHFCPVYIFQDQMQAVERVFFHSSNQILINILKTLQRQNPS